MIPYNFLLDVEFKKVKKPLEKEALKSDILKLKIKGFHIQLFSLHDFQKFDQLDEQKISL